LIDTGATVNKAALFSLYKLPSLLGLQVAPPLALPTAILGMYSSYCNGEAWDELDKQLLWEKLRHKMVKINELAISNSFNC